MILLSDSSSNTKQRKTAALHPELLLCGLSLAPANMASPEKSVCPSSTANCRAWCVAKTGLSRVFGDIDRGRISKTLFYMNSPAEFCRQLCDELRRKELYSHRHGLKLCCRLNVLSDIPFENHGVPQSFPDSLFYDYTKIHSRISRLPANYHICGSWSENPRHQAACLQLLQTGHNVSVVFAERGDFAGNAALRQRIPGRFVLPGSSHAWDCFDGDQSDIRLQLPGYDPLATRAGNGRICALRLKSHSVAERNAAIESEFVFVV